MTKSKIGLPSVDITLLYALTTSTLVDLQVFTAKLQDAGTDNLHTGCNWKV